ncbi:MAG: DUF5655 domain-containing protein [Roseiflexaceae bacterium]|nr:DUF5655 domain-containing protein [Roseiflexaceae bacterium]
MSDAADATMALFAGGDPDVQATYERLLAVLEEIGPFRVEPKKTSIHIVRETGFAGVHPRKRSLILNLRTAQPIQHARITKTEQVSRNRYHNEVKLEQPDDVDAEIIGWLRDAYET